MPTFVSLLRGINVSGQKKIRMADLRSLYEGLGFTGVQSYIQSGNVVFDAPVKGAGTLVERIEAAIQQAYAFEVPVVIRTHDELQQVVAGCPFGSVDVDKDGTRVAVAFLSGEPTAAGVDSMAPMVVSPEKLVVVGCEAYLHYPDGMGKSKLTTALLEKRLGVTATARNWKTVLRLVELSRSV